MKIVVPIPVFGRLPLLKLTIERLYNVNKVHKVICVGHEPEAKLLCESLGCEWVEHENSPLGKKWNAGFMACEKYAPDAVLYCGSSDWVSKEYLDAAAHYIENGCDFYGALGCYFVDVAARIRMVYWPGYVTGSRANEPIGIGRVLSRNILTDMNWKPFNGEQNNSLDKVMWEKIFEFDTLIKIEQGRNGLISISTNRWENKHIFQQHWSNQLPSEKIEPPFEPLFSFPEIFNIR